MGDMANSRVRRGIYAFYRTKIGARLIEPKIVNKTCGDRGNASRNFSSSSDRFFMSADQALPATGRRSHTPCSWYIFANPPMAAFPAFGVDSAAAFLDFYVPC